MLAAVSAAPKTGTLCLVMPLREQRFRETLDHLLEGFQIVGPDWQYLYVNPVAASHGRTTPEELHGKTMLEAYPGIETTLLFATLERCMKERVPQRLENRFEFVDAPPRWFELRVEPVPEGLCIHSIDIEDRKRGEVATRDANLELERRVAERTVELQEAIRELDAFSYSVAHDLRAPLRAIDGFAQLLMEDAGDALNDEGKQHLDRVRSAARRMSVLIDDLLALSRVSRTELDRHDTNLTEIARSVANELASREPSRVVRFEISEGLRARCDPALARIVFENVLGNAWKFTMRAEHAVIAVRPADEPFSIAVEDNGAGFDMALAHRLFKPFQRLHLAREFSGTGIGLSIVERVIRKHGGSIRAESALDHGTTLTFSFEGPSSPESKRAR